MCRPAETGNHWPKWCSCWSTSHEGRRKRQRRPGTCSSVQELGIGQHLSFPLVAVWVTIGLCACLLGLLVALACVCRKHLKQSCEEEQEEAGNGEHEENGELKTAMQPLKASSAEGDDTSTLE